MRSSLRFGVMAAVLFSGMALPRIADASPIDYKIGTFVFMLGDPDLGISGYASLFNLTPCHAPADPSCLPAGLQNTSFGDVSFSDGVGTPTMVGSVLLSVDYVTFDLSAQSLFVSLTFLGSPLLGPFSLAVDATLPTDIFFNYDADVQTPVPEPGSLLLLATGVAALACCVRRKRLGVSPSYRRADGIALSL